MNSRKVKFIIIRPNGKRERLWFYTNKTNEVLLPALERSIENRGLGLVIPVEI